MWEKPETEEHEMKRNYTLFVCCFAWNQGKK
jgi:hypothetical protein